MKDKQKGSLILIIAIVILIMLLFCFSMIEEHSLTILIYKRNEQIMLNDNIAQEILKILLMRQNQDKNYFFKKENYEKLEEDFGLFKPIIIFNSNNVILGKGSVKISPNPIIHPQSQYDLEIEAVHFPYQSKQIIKGKISATLFQEYQYFSQEEADIISKENFGKIYSPLIYLEKEIIFWNNVEFLKGIINEQKGIFNGRKHKLDKPYISLNKVINFEKLKEATQKSSLCGNGIGLYIGNEGSPEYTEVIKKHFKRDEQSYQIDLGKLHCHDPSNFISYNNEVLPRFDNSNSEFNGIIYVDGDVHIWGILGGASQEDFYIIDKDENFERLYEGPDGLGNNKYSNNTLDKGEDSNYDGYLDESGKGCNLIIVSKPSASIIIDHNIFQPPYPNWKQNKLFLVSGGTIVVAPYSPKTLIIEASIIATETLNGFSFIVQNSPSGRLKNYWAKNLNEKYVYDLNSNSVLETNNGEGQPNDQNEFDIKEAYSLIIRGNLILKGKANFGEYLYNNHIIKFIYDDKLLYQQLSCYPYIPIWKAITGSLIKREEDFMEE